MIQDVVNPLTEKSLSGHVDQMLVRLESTTHVVDVPLAVDHGRDGGITDDDGRRRSHLLEICSMRSGWPLQYLRIISWSPPFCSVRVVSSIRGGKGGFGTLLKGQSKQAGAKMTTDFGACRDLQGRRLRHVNDEIKLRRWRDLQQRKAAGEDVNELSEMLQTPTGLYNWYLLTPNWAGLSGKGTRKVQRQMKRQFRQWQSEEEQVKEAKRMREEEYQQSVAYYVNRTMEVAGMIQKSTAEAVLKGLGAAKGQQKQKQDHRKNNAKGNREESSIVVSEGSANEDPVQEVAISCLSEEQQPQSLLTLTGDVIIEKSESHPIRIQSKSEFSTVAFVFDNVPKDSVLYYEIKVVTGGVAQVGWAAMMEQEFHPNSETGDGVGDDGGSFAYDGSRGLKFHKGQEETYGTGGSSSWKAGDVVGCLYDSTTGQISYSLNGSDLGIAFTATPSCPLVPAVSCNHDEILEFHVHANEMQYQPALALTVGSLLLTSPAPTYEQVQTPSVAPNNNGGENVSLEQTSVLVQEEKQQLAERQSKSNDVQPTAAAKICQADVSKDVKPLATAETVKAEPLDLNEFSSAKELEDLGLDKLKGALMALGVKCGGSLQERAARLFSLKGLERDAFPKRVLANKKSSLSRT